MTAHAEQSAPARKPRRRVAVGPSRPGYMADGEVDKMMMIVTALATEVSALRDRVDTHEALAEQGIVATPAAIEAHVCDPAREAARDAARMAMLRRVFRVVTEEVDALRETGAAGAKAPGASEWSMPEGWDKT